MTETGDGLRDAILAADSAFREAVERRDQLGMATCWSRRSPVLCIHPGEAPLTTREEILASWSGLFGGSCYIEVTEDARSIEAISDLAWVTAVEHIVFYAVNGASARGTLFVTRVLRREAGHWMVAAHIATPLPEPLSEVG